MGNTEAEALALREEYKQAEKNGIYLKEHKRILSEGGSLPPWVSFTVTPYDLRHSFCAFGRDHGVELNTMISWMGHTDAQMILKIYDEVSDFRDQQEAEKLNKNLLSMQIGMQTEKPEESQK